jgi:hypothetical protein
MKSLLMFWKASLPRQSCHLCRTALILGALLLSSCLAQAQNNILELRGEMAFTQSSTLQGVITQGSPTAKTTSILAGLWFDPQVVDVTFTKATIPGVTFQVLTNGKRTFTVSSGQYQGTQTAYVVSMSLLDTDKETIGVQLPPGTVFGTYTVTRRYISPCYRIDYELPALGWTESVITSPPPPGPNRSRVFTDPPASTSLLNGTRRLTPPRAAILAGQVELEGIDANAFPFITLEFGPTIGTQTIQIDSSSYFGIACVDMNYPVVRIKGPKWLAARTQMVDASEPGFAALYVELRAGDANNDNSVDVLDLDRLIPSFDLAEGDPDFLDGADLNCDTLVDVLDLDLLIRNFGMQGDD